MISLEQAEELKPGQLLYHTVNTRVDGSPERWTAQAWPKAWGAIPPGVHLFLVRAGACCGGIMTEADLDAFALTEEDAIEARDHVIG